MLDEAVMIAEDALLAQALLRKESVKTKFMSTLSDIVITDGWIKCVLELWSTCFPAPHRALYH